MNFLLAVFALFVSAIVLVDASSKKRVTFIDLPTAQTSIVWTAGQEVHVPFCWAGWFKQPHNMPSHEWKLKLKRSFRSSIELEPTFTPFKDFMANKAPDSKKWGSLRWKYLTKKSVTRIPVCWVASFHLPEDLGSSGGYYLELTRVRDFIWDRSYKSPKFRIERPFENIRVSDSTSDNESVDPAYHAFSPADSSSELKEKPSMKQSAKDLWKKTQFWKKPKQSDAEVDLKPLENSAQNNAEFQYDANQDFDNDGNRVKKTVSFSTFQPGLDSPFDRSATNRV